MSTDMDETFAASLRAELVDQVGRSSAARRARRRRRVVGGVAVLALAGGGSAIATSVFSGQPGSVHSAQVGAPVTVNGVGSRTVRVGPAPAAANFLNYTIRCFTPGRIVLIDASGSTSTLTCQSRAAEAASGSQEFSAPVDLHAHGLFSFAVRTAANDRWELTAQYVHSFTTPWGVNARGQTYGRANDRGVPDLLALTASDGRPGYVYADQYRKVFAVAAAQEKAGNSQAPNLINVYASDGATVIGQFNVGPPLRFVLGPDTSHSHTLIHVGFGLTLVAGLAVSALIVTLARRRTRAV